MKLSKEQIKDASLRELRDALAEHIGFSFKMSSVVNQPEWHDMDGYPFIDCDGYMVHPIPISLDYISNSMMGVKWEKHSGRYFTTNTFCYVEDTSDEYLDRLRLYCLLLVD